MARKTKAQALETRQQIIDAALNCFSKRGVSSTSLAEIAVTAGVTRGAIYWHFKNKTDLLQQIYASLDQELELDEQRYLTQYPEDPLAQFRALLIDLLRSVVTNQGRRALFEIYYHKCEFVGEMEEFMRRQQEIIIACYPKIEEKLRLCQAYQQLPTQLNQKRAAIIIRAYISGLIENWLFTPENFSLDNQAERLVDSLIDMLRFSPNL